MHFSGCASRSIDAHVEKGTYSENFSSIIMIQLRMLWRKRKPTGSAKETEFSILVGGYEEKRSEK